MLILLKFGKGYVIHFLFLSFFFACMSFVRLYASWAWNSGDHVSWGRVLLIGNWYACQGKGKGKGF